MAEPGPCDTVGLSRCPPRPTWRCSPRRAAAPCARSSAGSAAAVTRTGPACSRNSGRPGETPLPLPPFLPDVTVPLSWGGLWGHPLGREPPGRVGSAGCGAGGSVLLPPARRCPSEDRLLPFSSWRFTFYLIAFIAGMAVIVDVSIAAPSPRSPGPPDPSDSSLSVSPSPSRRNLGSTTSGRCGRDTPSR